MRIALRVFLSYVLLSVLLGGATLLAAYWSVESLITGTLTETAAVVSREVGLFLLTSVGGDLRSLTPEDEHRLSEMVTAYAQRSARVENVILVDADGRIRAASDPSVVGLQFKDEAERAILASNETTIREIPWGHGGFLSEITTPLTSVGDQRIGTIRVQIIPEYFATYLDKPRRNGLRFFAALIVFISASGVALAFLLTIPVRRLNRTLESFQQGEGAARLDLDENSDFAPALRVVRGLGERIEALAERGRSNELVLTTMTRALQQGVIVADAQGRIVSINDAGLRLLGMDGTPGSSARADLSAVQAIVDAHPGFAAMLKGPVEPGAAIDIPGAARGGVRLTAHPLRDGGAVAGTMLLLRDLASLRAMETHLQEAARLSLLARLTATMAHEIKNPLNAMVINVEALRAQVESVDGAWRGGFEESLGIIAGEIYHLDGIIRDYLGLAAGGERGAEHADVREAIEKSVELVKFEANQARVRVASDIARDLPPVTIGAVALRQALLNLCLNSIQAMESGGNLSVRAAEAGGGVRIEVEDTGPGIPEEIRSSIFNLDFTTKAGGSGLGLPITKVIVEAAGGRIDLDSAAGRGTRFRLDLPVAPA